MGDAHLPSFFLSSRGIAHKCGIPHSSFLFECIQQYPVVKWCKFHFVILNADSRLSPGSRECFTWWLNVDFHVGVTSGNVNDGILHKTWLSVNQLLTLIYCFSMVHNFPLSTYPSHMTTDRLVGMFMRKLPIAYTTYGKYVLKKSTK